MCLLPHPRGRAARRRPRHFRERGLCGLYPLRGPHAVRDLDHAPPPQRFVRRPRGGEREARIRASAAAYLERLVAGSQRSALQLLHPQRSTQSRRVHPLSLAPGAHSQAQHRRRVRARYRNLDQCGQARRIGRVLARAHSERGGAAGMKAVVMAGGEGSRLRPLTSGVPKPLVPVVGKPVMEHILRLLRKLGITDVVVTLQYLGSAIRDYFGDGSDFGVDITYVVEDAPLGTAGSVKNAQEYLTEPFIVISGDALTDIDLGGVMQYHREKGASATIVLTSVANPLEFGVVITNPDGTIKRFLEKPSWGEVFSDQVNTGIYVIEPEVLDLLSPGAVVDWSGDVFPKMLTNAMPLYGYLAPGYWCDIGNIQTYYQANWDALEGRVDVEIPGERRHGNVWIGENVEIGYDVRINGPAYIGNECKLKAGGFINGPGCVGNFSVVDENTKISKSIIWTYSYIGENSRLRHAIVCRHVTIKNNCLLEEGAVIGDDVVVGEGSTIDAGVKIWPDKEIEPGSTLHERNIWAGHYKRGLFSSYGINGLVNIELTPEYCARLCASFAALFPKGSAIGAARDGQRPSRMMKT